MNKAEEKSREYVLPFLDKQYEKYGEHKQMELSRFDGYDMMSAYEEGYHQAEKDMELTWEDIKVIEKLLGFDNIIESPKEFYQEVLKRFKDLRNERPF